MASEAGKKHYRKRGATVECANAQLRRRGLQQFNVRGLLKARAVLLWHALAHNLMRMRSPGAGARNLNRQRQPSAANPGNRASRQPGHPIYGPTTLVSFARTASPVDAAR